MKEEDLKEKVDPKDLMAVERAVINLIGLSISLIVLGFIVEKFELFLHIVATELRNKTTATTSIPQLQYISFYNYLGIVITIAGVILALYTYRYYIAWIKHLENNEIVTDKRIYFILSIFIASVGIILIASMIFIS